MLMKRKVNILGPGGCLPNESYAQSPGGSFSRGRENTKDERLNFGRKPMKTNVNVRMRNKLIIGFMIMLMAVALIPAMAFAVSDEEAVSYLRSNPAALVTVGKGGTTKNLMQTMAASAASINGGALPNLVAKYDAKYNTGVSHRNTATTFADLSGNGHTGIANNVTWGTDYAEFNGTNSWVNLGEINSNYVTLEITFSVTNHSGQTHELIGNWEGAGGGLWIEGGRKLGGNFYINGAYHYLESSDTVEVGKKYHAALTYDGSVIKLYL